MFLIKELAGKLISGKEISRDDALAILEAKESDTFSIVEEASKVRGHFWQNRIRLHMLINAKSGLCPEDCGYCSQSIESTAEIFKYPLVSKEKLIQAADKACKLKIHTLCIVNSGKAPAPKELEQIGEAVRTIKEQFPMNICVCLGLLKEGEAEFLKGCGVNTYNHNLNTSREFYPAVCTTHTFNERLQTVAKVKNAGLDACSGGIVGMGETSEDIVNMAFELKALKVHSVPVNFLHPVNGTPLADVLNLTPLKALRILAMFRFVYPEADLRIAGGRELHLRTLQPFAIRIANSIFIGDYLTTKGQLPKDDYKMIEDIGLEIELPQNKISLDHPSDGAYEILNERKGHLL